MRTPMYMHSRNVVAMRKPFSMLQPSKHTEKQGCGRKALDKWDTKLDIVFVYGRPGYCCWHFKKKEYIIMILNLTDNIGFFKMEVVYIVHH